MPSSLQTVAHRPLLWRGDNLAVPDLPCVPTGFAMLDEALPGGGWPRGALTEILPARTGIGEISLLAPALTRLSRQEPRWIVWVAPPHIPYAPALQATGMDLSRLVVIAPRSTSEALWATRQALGSDCCSAVLSWLAVPDHQSLRRLQLAVEGRRTTAFLFRPAFAARDFSPAPLRLSLESAAGRLAVQVLKRRGALLTRPVPLDIQRPTRNDAVVRPLSAESAAAGIPACCA